MDIFSRRKTERNDDQAVELLVASALRALKDPSSLPPPKPPQQWHARVYVGLKSLGLNVVTAWRRQPKEQMVAVRESRQTAAIRCLVHMVPLAVALTLLVLNFSNHYLSSTISSELTTVLQFAAKLHELTMIASLTTTLLSITCYFLIRHDGLPLGMAFASLQAIRLSYIYSPEFLGALRSNAYGWRFRSCISLVCLLFSVLIATVGPSSAACMIPRYRPWVLFSWPYKTDEGKEAFFPVELSLSTYQNVSSEDTRLLSTPGPPSRSDFESLSRMLSNFSDVVAYIGMESGKYSAAPYDLRAPWSVEGYTNPFTLSIDSPTTEDGEFVATTSIQSIVSASISEETVPHIHSTAFVELDGSMDASSTVQCLFDNSLPFDWSQSAPRLNFSNGLEDSESTISGADVKNIQHYFEGLIPTLAFSAGKFVDSWNVSNDPCEKSSSCATGDSQLLFFTGRSPDNSFGAVVASVGYMYATGAESFTYHIELLPCTFQLQWRSVTTQFTVAGISSHHNGQSSTNKEPQIALPNDEWLENSNPQMGNSSSAFTIIAPHTGWPQVAISMLLTVALSRSAQPKARIWMEDAPLMFSVTGYEGGYGWSTDSTAVRLSLAILVLYCIVALAHIIYSVWTGISSTAWDSISEVVALALNSPSPVEMTNTSAGIKTSKVFEHRVRIAVTSDGKEGSLDGSLGMEEPSERKLALLFPSDEKLIASDVRVNTAYGT